MDPELLSIYYQADGAEGGSNGGDSSGGEDNTDTPEKKSDAELFYPETDAEGQGDEDKEEGEGEPKEEEPESKDDEGKDDESEGEDKEEKEDESGYSDFEVPEGFEPVEDAAKELFKKHELSQEAAQELVDYGAKLQQKTIDAIAEAQIQQEEAWKNETLADPEIKKDLNKGISFLKQHAEPEFVSFLDETGLANHPQMARFVIKMAKSVSEDSMDNAPSSSKNPEKRTDAEIFYGKS